MELANIYEDYRKRVSLVRSGAGLAGGLFGMGENPKNNPCHREFFQAVGSWIREFLARQPEPEGCLAVLEYLVQAPSQCRDRDCYWMMFAAMGWGTELVTYLAPEDCGKARELMDKLYPPRDRFPAQQRLYRLLSKKVRGK